MAGKRSKSPNFPAFSLREAVDRTRTIFAQEGKSRIDPASAVRALRYSSLNGASLRALGALRHYGLIEDVQGDVKVSDLAIRILHGDDADREKALKEASMRPKVFNELIQEYGTDIPSDESLKAKLITRMNFSNPEAAALCVQAFRETIELAKLQFSGYIGSNSAPKESDDNFSSNINKISITPGSASIAMGDVKQEMNHSYGTGKSFVRLWSLSEGITARLEINAIPNQEDQEFLKLCLDRALKELAKRNEDASKESASEDEMVS